MYSLASIIISNTFGIILMIIILANSEKTYKAMLPDEALWNALVWCTLILCATELLSFISDSSRYPCDIVISRILNSILFMLNLLPVFLWLAYVNYKIYESTVQLKKIMLYSAAPVVVTFVCGFLNIFFDIFFTVSPENVYNRTFFAYIPFILAFIYLLIAMFTILLNRKKVKKYIFMPILLFMVLPVCGALAQAFVYGVSLMWPMTALSIIVVYLNVQKETASIDTLTGCYSRMRLDSYLNGECSKKRLEEVPLIGIMLDVDKFKTINDTYGHAVGDNALESVGFILRSSVSFGDFVARYAGDEFIIISKASDTSELENIVSKIQATTNEFNRTQNKPYNLSFSFGCTVFGIDKDDSIDKFLKRMDVAMYKEKSAKACLCANSKT